MKPNIKSGYFKFSLVFVLLFFVQSLIESRVIVSAIKNNKPTGSIEIVYWLGLLWLAVASVLYYKATTYRQSFSRQLLIFIIAPFVLAPIAGLIYFAIVVLPTYSLISQSGFSH